MSWQSRNQTISMKVIRFIVTVTFIFSNSQSYAFSGQTLFGKKPHSQRYVKSKTEASLIDIKDNPAAINLPSGYGQIVESYKGKGDTLIVHIQDNHVDQTAQFNISRILKTLLQNYDMGLLCLEGASKKLDTSFYDSFPDGQIKEKVSRFFVKKALFTGAEYFKITNQDLDISAFGVEDKNLYIAHLKAYQDNQPEKEKIISYLSRLETGLDNIKTHLYPKPLKELELKKKEYQSKTISLAEYALYLARSAKGLILGIRPYPNFGKFVELTKREKEIDFEKAEQQRKRLVEELSQELEEKELNRLLKMSMDYRLNKISANAFYDYLQGLFLITNHHSPMTNYQELLSYIDYLKRASQINHLKLFDEIESINGEIASAIFETPAQKSLFRFSKSLALLKDLYNLRLTHQALDYMKEKPEEFDIRRIELFIKTASNSLGIPAPPDDELAYADAQGIKAAQRFYKIAIERDMALVNNTLKRLPFSSNKTALLVAGGFHTSGITNILREKEISYVIICPNIGMGDNQRLYADRIKGMVPDYADILQVASEGLVPALATGGITDGLKIKTAFSVAFAGILQSEGLKRFLELNEGGLTLPDIGDERAIGLKEAAEIIRAAITESGKVPVAELPLVSIKMASAGKEDIEAIRDEVDREFSYEYKPQKAIMPDERTAKSYHFARDKDEIIRMLEERNWYYRDYNQQERGALTEKIWGGLEKDAPEHIKENVASTVGIKKEDIVSVILYGSWAYTEGRPSDMDVAVIVKGEHIKKIIPDCLIEHPEQVFSKNGRRVDHLDLNIISEDYLREATDPSAIAFLTAMWGHGILLEGMDYLRSPPTDHNILILARYSLVWTALLYCKNKILNDDGSPIGEKDRLRKIERRTSEAKYVFKLLFSESHLGVGDEKMGREPTLEAIEEILSIIDKPNQDYDLLSRILGELWQQTETGFIEERLIAQETERRLAQIRSLPGVDKIVPLATTIRTSSAGSAVVKEREPFSVKSTVRTAAVTAAVGGLTHLGAVVLDPPSDTKLGMETAKDDPSDARISERPGAPKKPQPGVVTQPARIALASAKPRPEAVSLLRTGGALITPTVKIREQQISAASEAALASIFRAPQIQMVHPAVYIAEESLPTKEQLKNYQAAYGRVNRMVELVFGNTITEEEKRCWQLLLLGTEATETNFLDKYSKVLPSGNGRYQIIGDTAYGIIHNYVSYPIIMRTKEGEVVRKTGLREELLPLFGKATNGRVSWQSIKDLNKQDLRKLLASNDDFSCLISILVYKDEFERKGIRLSYSNAGYLGTIWKRHYNTRYGDGTVKRFVERFGLIHKPLSSSLRTLYTKTWAEYMKLYSERARGAENPREQTRKSIRRFTRELGLIENFSERASILLRDEYGITASNIFSRIDGYKGIFNNRLWYARFKEDRRVHVVVYKRKGKIFTHLVVCDDISKWATGNEKAEAEISIGGILYTGFTRPFLKEAIVKTRAEEKGISFAIELMPSPLLPETAAATARPASARNIDRSEKTYQQILQQA